MASQNNPTYRHRQAYIQKADPEIRIHYIEAIPSSDTPKGTILLIHGFPQTSYQFRHAIKPLADAGYHVLAPDYRGHGNSSHPLTGYTKDILAQDMHDLVTKHAGIDSKIHLVGHDIGGMIAHAYVAQFPNDVASVVWGECPLPGTTVYEENKHSDTLWHFNFHAQSDIAEALVAGKEKIYLKHFFDRLTQNPEAISNADLDIYTAQYSSAGAMRCAFLSYKLFDVDAEWNREWRERNGKVRVRSMVLSGEFSAVKNGAEEMAKEMYEMPEVGFVEGSGHYLAEENPEDFVRKVLGFVEAS